MVIETAKKLIILDPTVEAIPVEARVAPRLKDMNGKRLGLLANGKPNATEFLRHLVSLLEEEYKFTSVVEANKRNASRVARTELLDELASKCDIALVAIGD